MKAARRRSVQLAPFVAIGLLAAALGLAGYFTEALSRYELDTVDARFAIRGDRPAPTDVVVVAIDDRTFNLLGVQWPFPRSLHAKVIDNLWEADAKVIAFDVQFTERTRPKQDEALLESIYNAGNVVLATTETDAQGGTNVLGGEETLRQVGARVGSGVFSDTDPGGVIRRVREEEGGLETFGLVAAEVYRGGAIPRDGFRDGSAWIDFAGGPGHVTTLSYVDVLRNRFDPAVVRGKVAVVGPTATSLQDLHPTSTTTDELMSGAEVEASVVDTALRGFPLRWAPRWLDVLAIVLLAMLPPLLAARLPFAAVVPLALLGGVLFAVAAQLAFQHGTVLAFTYPVGAFVLAAGGTALVAYFNAVFERRRVRDLFARFVPEDVVDDVLAQTDEDLRLGGVGAEGTVMFTDLRGFTTFSERRSPEQVIAILNRYLGEMSEAILDHGGTLVSYMGDGIMAVFGAPIEQPDHAERALTAAREMLTVRLPRVNEWLRTEAGIDAELRMGIGLNSGRFMSGNVGSERRLEYTAIGDTVNTASRIEALTKEAAVPLLVAESTRGLLPDDGAGLVFLDELPIRGRAGTVRLWTADFAPTSDGPGEDRAVGEEGRGVEGSGEEGLLGGEEG